MDTLTIMEPRKSSLRAFFLLAYALTWLSLGPWFYVFNTAYRQKIPNWLWIRRLWPLLEAGDRRSPQITSICVMMTVLFLNTKGSVLLAIFAHLAFNTAEAVLFGGLPDLALEQRRAVYLVNVALLGVLGLASLGGLATREKKQGP